MGADNGHPAKRIRLLVLVLGLVIVVAACAGNGARPAATSSITPPPSTPGATGTSTLAAHSRDEVVRLFDYDRRRPLAVTKLGSNTGRVPVEELVGVTVHTITYPSPRGWSSPERRGHSPA